MVLVGMAAVSERDRLYRPSLPPVTVPDRNPTYDQRIPDPNAPDSQGTVGNFWQQVWGPTP